MSTPKGQRLSVYHVRSASKQTKVRVPGAKGLDVELILARPELGLHATNLALDRHDLQPTADAPSELVTTTALILSAFLC